MWYHESVFLPELYRWDFFLLKPDEKLCHLLKTIDLTSSKFKFYLAMRCRITLQFVYFGFNTQYVCYLSLYPVRLLSHLLIRAHVKPCSKLRTKRKTEIYPTNNAPVASSPRRSKNTTLGCNYKLGRQLTINVNQS